VPPNAGGKEHRYVLTASGRDRIGFVASVSSFCARQNINILDLSTAVSDGSYTMILLVDLSRCPDLAEMRRQLKAFAQESGLRLVLQHYDIFKATNEVSVL
jgi:predicted amino acid-binding ACT domain protein